MFLHVSVSHSVHMGGDGIPACIAGFCPLAAGKWYSIMHCRSSVPHPGGKLRGLAWGGLQAHIRGQGVVGIPACTEASTPQQMATAAGSTHPTGMLSCFHAVYG